MRLAHKADCRVNVLMSGRGKENAAALVWLYGI